MCKGENGAMAGARKVVIIGGVAGGASAGARARRLDEKAHIVVFEKGPDPSFANCGMPVRCIPTPPPHLRLCLHNFLQLYRKRLLAKRSRSA